MAELGEPLESPPMAVAVEFGGPGLGTLRGLRSGTGERWALFVHDEDADLDSWRSLARWLAGRGFTAFAFDLPGRGASDDPWEPAGATAAVAAAVGFALTSGAGQVHLIGAGTGALAVLAAAGAGAREVVSAVLFSPRLDDRVAMLEDVREARLPKLILVGSESPAALEAAEAVFRKAIGPCELVQFPVLAQGTELLVGAWAEQAREKLLAHISRYR
jgi:pimeloyl-ACP methyl ester carboxylesterase